MRLLTFPRILPISSSGVVALLFVVALLVFQPAARSQEAMQDMPGMEANEGEKHLLSSEGDRAAQVKLLADRRESEFNHHLAGFLIVLAGVFILAQELLAARWPLARYAWPLCFLAAGLFVLIFSDTEIWPLGDQNLYYALTHNMEDLQHKVFSIILLVLGFVETQRVRGRLKAAWSAWVFPVLSLAGVVLLLFHSHEAGMHGPDPMALMEHIQLQHRWYASVGFGIVLTKGLSEVPTKWGRMFNKTWPVLLIVLGASLALYSE
jgi:putative copper resistance protein D